MSGIDTCPACFATDLVIFHEQSQVPAHSVMLMPTREVAVSYPKGDLRLGFCQSCGFITNTVFDVSLNDYSQNCEETQGFSPTFREWLQSATAEFIERYDIRGKKILEIGCGKGEFLSTICELGDNTGVGIDPAYVPGRLSKEQMSRLEFINDLYDEKYADIQADVIVHRHTLEHISPVAEHLRVIRKSIGERKDVLVFFELPESRRVFEQVAFWDVYYEHCSYFTPGSLTRLFRREGFDVLNVQLAFDDQYILLHAKPGDGRSPSLPLEDDLQETAQAVEQFRVGFAKKIEELRTLVMDNHAQGGRTVIWGAGSKGVAFLTTLAVGEAIEYAVDINPNKQGMFMPGTGHEVVGPEFLREYQPSLVLAMNPIYVDEIGQDLQTMGIEAKLLGV